MTDSTYSGPDYHQVVAVNEWDYAVESNRGVRIGTYPGLKMARRVATLLDKQAMRDYLNAGRRRDP